MSRRRQVDRINLDEQSLSLDRLKSRNNRMRCLSIRHFVILLTAAGMLTLLYLLYLAPSPATLPPHIAHTEQLSLLAALPQYDKFNRDFLTPILIPRNPGSPGHEAVVRFIHDSFDPNIWSITRQSFKDWDPRGNEYDLTNVMAESDRDNPDKLVFACHHDSKAIQVDPRTRSSPFLGATDSAVPCAMLLQLAKIFTPLVKSKVFPKSLVFLFLDGEEAFEEWTATDSLYGARYFVKHIEETRPGFLKQIQLFTLLDLIGAESPSFVNSFPTMSSQYFNRLKQLERKLSDMRRMVGYRSTKSFFSSRSPASISDDHEPFLKKGVPILHLISVPFPRVWHTMQDNRGAIHPDTVMDILKLMTLFMYETASGELS